MRSAAAWRHVTVEIAVLFLVAATMLLIRAGATRWADDSTGHPGTRRPGGAGGAAATPARDTEPRAASRRPAASHQSRTAGPDARLAAALAPVVAHHAGHLAVGVCDPATGVTATYDGRRAFDTASIVKADILAVLLLRHQQTGTALSQQEKELAAEMIEDSDNDAATALWDAVQAGPGLEAGNAALGLPGIAPGPGGYWGLTTTTVTGQLRLLAVLTSPRSPLHAPARHYELSLMRDVEPGQDWGVSAAATRGAGSAVKNGWLPPGPHGPWVINSIGVIQHAGQRLLIAVLSSGQPSEAAGIRQVQTAARAAASTITGSGP